MGIVYVKVLGLVAILEIRKLPSAQHFRALGGITSQAILTLVARCDGIDRHPVSLFEALNSRPQAINYADGLMTQGQVASLSDGASHGVHVRSADQGRGRLNNGIVGTRFGYGLLHDSDLTNPMHDEDFHDF